MKTLKNLLFLFGILCVSYNSYAQDAEKLISGDFENKRAGFVIAELSAQSGYKFYYDPAHLDSIVVNIKITQQKLASALPLILKNTSFSFFLDEDRKAVFITKNVAITSLRIAPVVAVQPGISSEKVIKPTVLSDQLAAELPTVSIENKLFEIGVKTAGKKTGEVSLAGYVFDKKTGEPVVGTRLYIENPRIGTTTNQHGYYALSLPAGRQTLQIRTLGKKDIRRELVLHSDGKLNIEVEEQVTSLKEVVISTEKAANLSSTVMGMEKLDIKTIKQVPTVFGEPDIIRVLLTLPGVQSVGEASSGFNVRGGAVDQNLILFSDMTIYNPSHFFGFFSAFNPEVVKDVELYKSSIPARYGGRLSSVLDVSSRDGNNKKFTGSAGLGLITSRVNIEGPIVKDKTSFILAGRTTYSDWLLKSLPEKSAYRNASASFYDLNLSVSHKAGEKNSLNFNGYISSDESDLATDTTFAYQNKNLSVNWKHSFNNKFFSTLTAGADQYQYENYTDFDEVSAYRLRFNINQANFKADFNYYLSQKHTLDFGLSSVYFKLNPGTFEPRGTGSLIKENIVAAEQGLESAIYLSDRYTPNPNFSLEYGVRLSMFNFLGPQQVNEYAPGLPKNEANVVDTKQYSSGDLISTNIGPEFRVSGRYIINSTTSIKAGVNTLRQNIHLLSNTTTISPTDIWKLSDNNIKAQKGAQVSIGAYKNLKSNTIETSAEVYYKTMKDFLDYKSGASLILNHHIEQDVIGARGKAYGIELMVKKLTGKVNGWASYTYSRTFLKVDDPVTGEQINRGQWYAANYDKPHDLTVIGNYRFNHRVSASLNVTYSTGRPITLPLGKFEHAGGTRVIYSDRNAFRIPDFFRSDLSVNLDGNHKLNQLFHNSWTFGVYNLTGQKNAYSVYYASEKQLIKGYKLSIFGTAIPFINYNIRF
jgi:hypothetical protein